MSKEVEKYVEYLAGDFRNFLTELWREVDLPQPALHQLDIAHWLQHGPRRRGVRAFRGASKTWITIAYCLWRLFIDNNERIMLVSKSEAHSKSSLHMARQWIDKVRFLQHLTPDRKSGGRDSAIMFDVAQAPMDRTPSFAAFGIGGQLTGGRASILIGDDPETPVNSTTFEQRQKLREDVKEFDNILIPGGDIIFLGTPHHEESLYDKLSDSGYEFRSWPVRIPNGEHDVPYLSPMYEDLLLLQEQGIEPGKSVWPERFDEDELREREASEGKSTFAMQYQLVSKLGDELQYPLKLADIIVFPVQRDKAPLTIAWGTVNDRGGTTRCQDIPSLGFGTDGFFSPIMFDDRWIEYIGTKMWIDPSGRGKDKTAYAICSFCNGFIYVKAVGGLEGGFEEPTLNGLAYQARLHDAREIYVEANWGQEMFTRLFEPVLAKHFVREGDAKEHQKGWQAGVESIRVSGQKEIRILGSLEGPMQSHRVVFSPEVARNQDLQHQMTRLTRQRNCLRHDDEVEALAMCIAQWSDYLSTDPQDAKDGLWSGFIEDQLRQHYQSMEVNYEEPRWFKHQ